jgi:hypothetical protein
MFGECEAGAAPDRLIMGSANRKASMVAEQQSSDCTVANKEYVACSISA